MSGPDFTRWPLEAGLRRYLPWRAGHRANGRLAKVPHTVRGSGLYPQNPLDSAGWMTLADTGRYVRSGQADGAGVVLTPDLGWVAVDLDHCRDADGHLSSFAQTVLDQVPGAYAEISPSGSGLHLLLRGQIPTGARYHGFDVIRHGYLTMTGQVLRPAGETHDASQILARWRIDLPAVAPQPEARVKPWADPSDDALIARASLARNGPKFTELWAGGLAGYRSLSEGDLALALLLLYWAGDQDDGRADRLFRCSGRYRARWDLPEHHPYGQRTWSQARRIRAGASR